MAHLQGKYNHAAVVLPKPICTSAFSDETEQTKQLATLSLQITMQLKFSQTF